MATLVMHATEDKPNAGIQKGNRANGWLVCACSLAAATSSNEIVAASHEAQLQLQRTQTLTILRARAMARLRSLDVFRGLTMAGMVIVDNQGDFGAVYRQLDEDFWDGLRLCNLVFPSFIFAMGTSLPLALSRYKAPTGSPTVGIRKAVMRSLKLFALGVLLNLAARKFGFGHVRIMGVLQRLALCNVVGSIAFLALPRAALAILPAAALAVYGVLLLTVPLGGECHDEHLTANCNIGAVVDRAIMTTRHMIHPTDPEGWLSTLPALVNAHAGIAIGLLVRWCRASTPGLPAPAPPTGQASRVATAWRTMPAPTRAACCMTIGSAACLAAGYALTLVFPLNKELWSPSFALVSTGYSLAAFACCFAALDLRVAQREVASARLRLLAPDPDSGTDVDRTLTHADHPSSALLHRPPSSIPAQPLHTLRRMLGALGRVAPAPCEWLGKNPLVVFVGMVAVEILLLDYLTCPAHGTMWACVHRWLFGWLPYSRLASLLTSLVHLLLWVVVAGVLHKYRVYVKV